MVETNNSDVHRSKPRTTYQRWKATSLPNKAMVIATIVIALSNLGYTCYAKWTLSEIRSGQADTKLLAESAKAQAEALSKQYQEMVAARERTDKLIQRATEQAESTNKLAQQAARSANASERLAKISGDSLRFSENSLKIQERAWVGVLDLTLVEQIEAGKPIKVRARFQNTGKSPALNLSWHNNASIDIPPRSFFEGRYMVQGIDSRAPLLPGQNVESGEVSTLILNPPQLARLNNRFITLYFFGVVSYSDVFMNPHTTRFCGRYDTQQKTFLSCPDYNEAD